MTPSSSDEIPVEKCRLCSSKKNLISLFCGKAKDRRDYLRKLIKDFVDITIEYDDTISTRVCIVCCIYIYNIYNFKQLAKTTETNLKSFTKKSFSSNSSGRTKKKLENVPLKDIKLPTYEELHKNLYTWLQKKYVDTKLNQSSQSNQSSEGNSRDVGVLTDTLSFCNKHTQIEVDSLDNACQTVNDSKDSYAQTEPVEIRETSQTQSTSTQTARKTLTNIACTQTNKTTVMSRTIQCNLYKDKIHRPEGHKDKSVFMTALSLHHSMTKVKKCEKGTQSPFRSPRKRFHMSDAVPSHKIFVYDTKNHVLAEKSTQTDYLDLPNSFGGATLFLSKIEDKPTVPLNVITDSFKDVKNETTSPGGCLNLSESVSENDTVILSPASASLMKVDKKQKRVYICDMCDEVMYSIKEKTIHSKMHLFCSLCKKRFRKQHLAESHKKECGKSVGLSGGKGNEGSGEIHQNGKLFVFLDKLDFDDNVKRSYPNGFEQLQQMLQK